MPFEVTIRLQIVENGGHKALPICPSGYLSAISCQITGFVIFPAFCFTLNHQYAKHLALADVVHKAFGHFCWKKTLCRVTFQKSNDLIHRLKGQRMRFIIKGIIHAPRALKAPLQRMKKMCIQPDKTVFYSQVRTNEHVFASS